MLRANTDLNAPDTMLYYKELWTTGADVPEPASSLFETTACPQARQDNPRGGFSHRCSTKKTVEERIDVPGARGSWPEIIADSASCRRRTTALRQPRKFVLPASLYGRARTKPTHRGAVKSQCHVTSAERSSFNAPV